MFKKLSSRFNFSEKKDMEAFHETRVASLKALAKNKDFKTLVEYWEVEYDVIDNKIDGLTGVELEKAVLERRVVKKHLQWMQFMLSPDAANIPQVKKA